MPHYARPHLNRRRNRAPEAEALEQRSLLSAARSSMPPQKVAIQVPSAYISQQSGALDVTLVRSSPEGPHRMLGPLTVDFSAEPGALPPGVAATAAAPRAPFTPISEPVTFPTSATAETVAVPIDSAAPNAGLVPIQLAVTWSSPRVHSTKSTVYLAATNDVIPPSIIGVQRVKGGIAITFSKPMAPATVQNIRNYKVIYSPSQNFNPLYLTGVGIVQSIASTSQNIPLRRAVYDAADNTVILIPKQQLQSNGTYRISSPATLRAKGDHPHKAHALTDLRGNALDEGGNTAGAFSIAISKGRPYTASQPLLAAGD
jgi:hypothetical protein